MADPRACAADIERAERVNVGLVEDLVDALVHIAPECALLYASTCHVYGVPDSLPLTETHPLRPRGVYAETKARGEAAALAGVDRGLRVVVSRAFHQSGPAHGTAFALGDWAAQIASGAREVQVGDLSVCRDYTDVRDVGRGLMCLMEAAPSGAVVNLCSGQAPSMRSMLHRLIGKRPVEVTVDPARLRPAEVPVLVGDATQARDLGWMPSIPLETMLVDLLESYSSRTSILPSPSVS
jgi:GDP-4-dehydro-6-deoxy-D-mannose reductase